MGGLVPGLIGFRVLKPEISAKINDFLARRHAHRGRVERFHMGQGQKDGVRPFDDGLGGQGLKRQRHHGRQVRKDFSNRPTGGLLRRDSHQAHPGMGSKKTKELTARIPTGAHYGSLDRRRLHHRQFPTPDRNRFPAMVAYTT